MTEMGMTAVIIVDGKMTDCDKCRGPVTIQPPQPCTIGFSAEGGYDYVNMVVYVVNKKGQWYVENFEGFWTEDDYWSADVSFTFTDAELLFIALENCHYEPDSRDRFYQTCRDFNVFVGERVYKNHSTFFQHGGLSLQPCNSDFFLTQDQFKEQEVCDDDWYTPIMQRYRARWVDRDARFIDPNEAETQKISCRHSDGESTSSIDGEMSLDPNEAETTSISCRVRHDTKSFMNRVLMTMFHWASFGIFLSHKLRRTCQLKR